MRLAVVDGQDPVGNGHDDLHDVFDDDDGHAPAIDLLDQVNGLVHFLGVSPAQVSSRSSSCGWVAMAR